MAWIQIAFDTAEPMAGQIADLLEHEGAISVTLEAGDDQAILAGAREAAGLWETIQLTALFDEACAVDAVIDGLGRELAPEPLPRYEISLLADQDWTRSWMDRFEAMQFGTRLWVCPSWSSPPDPAAVNLVLDPGMAFGTGAHETTALCLEWLDSRAGLLAGAELIDYGCGSGVLAIAAALLGARQVWAVDIDADALQACGENAGCNGVLERIATGYPEQLGSIQADVLLANILSGPLQKLEPELAARIKPGGHLVLSGILAAQAAEVTIAYRRDFELEPPQRRGDWVMLHGRRI